MRLISSKATFLYKRIFPAFWFGFLALFIMFGLLIGLGDQFLFFLAGPVLMAGLGYVMMKKLVFDLVDEVWDDGTGLLIRNSGREDRVSLSDIMNVSYSPLMTPPRVTLLLRRPSIFGNQVTFTAPIRFIPFAASPVIEELIRRVDAARLG